MPDLIRVLLADDSTVTRLILTEAISAESDLEVVARRKTAKKLSPFSGLKSRM